MDDKILFAVNHDYVPEEDLQPVENYLTLNRNDIIEAKRSENADLLDDLSENKWILGYNLTTQKGGYFPLSYVTKKPTPTPRIKQTSRLRGNDSGYISPLSKPKIRNYSI